jgi:aspartyl protease family protein
MFKILTAAGLLVSASYVAISVAKSQLPAQSPTRPAAEPAAASVPQISSNAPGSVVLKADPRGHFNADLQVNGGRVAMMVDTGASIIALTHEDARRAGLYPNPADFRIPINTANGSIGAAPVRLREVRLDRILVRDVDAVVLPPGKLKTSLLGMSFLQRLSGFNVANNTLVLRQ